jgi:3-oxoacyl-(acyl-carrier-protein) synthase
MKKVQKQLGLISDQPAQAVWHVAARDAGEQLLDGEAHHCAVGGVDVHLRHAACERLEAPAAWSEGKRGWEERRVGEKEMSRPLEAEGWK